MSALPPLQSSWNWGSQAAHSLLRVMGGREVGGGVTQLSSGVFLATLFLKPCSCGVTSVWISLGGRLG